MDYFKLRENIGEKMLTILVHVRTYVAVEAKISMTGVNRVQSET